MKKKRAILFIQVGNVTENETGNVSVQKIIRRIHYEKENYFLAACSYNDSFYVRRLYDSECRRSIFRHTSLAEL